MPDSIKYFIQFFKISNKWWKDIFTASIYSTINKIFDIAPEILIGIAIDLVANTNNSFISSLGFTTIKSQLIFIGISTFLIWAFESLFQYLYMVKWRQIAQSIQHEYRVRCYKHVQSLDISWFENQKTGDVTSIINDDVNQLERFFNNGLNSIIQIVISSFLIGAIFFYISPIIALFTIVPIPIILLISIHFQKNLQPKYESVRKSVGTLSSYILNNIIGIATIKTFNSEKREADRINKASKDYMGYNDKAIRLSSAFVPIVRMGVLSGFLGTMIIGSFLAISGSIHIGSYGVLVFLSQRFLWPFTSLGETVDLFERSMASANRILSLLKIKKNIKEKKDAVVIKDLNKDIIFDNINFSYNDQSVVFKNLNLTIESKKLIGIVGQTGCGKTTLVKLLTRLYDCDSGQVRLGNEDIKNINSSSLRSQIGLVSQEPYLFDDTIKNNIIYPNRVANSDNLQYCCELSQSTEFIDSFPDVLETFIGERGQKLSGGQKQRLAIARALYKDPSILIFDEATSSIDNETEHLIQSSLREISKNRTTVVIAHRLSTVRNADKIYVLKNGAVHESGTHNKLLKNKSSYYKRLWDIQTGTLKIGD